jgi:hypothetical protein
VSQECVILGKRITGIEDLNKGGERAGSIKVDIAKSCYNGYEVLKHKGEHESGESTHRSDSELAKKLDFRDGY